MSLGFYVSQASGKFSKANFFAAVRTDIGVKKPQAATQWAMLQGQCISSEIAIPENGWVKSHLVKPPGLLKFLLGTEQNFCITANF